MSRAKDMWWFALAAIALTSRGTIAAQLDVPGGYASTQVTVQLRRGVSPANDAMAATLSRWQVFDMSPIF